MPFAITDTQGRTFSKGITVQGNTFGIVTLVAGTLTVANTNAVLGAAIFLTRQTLRGTPAELSVAINPGVGFTISTGSVAAPGSETSDIAYLIVAPV